VQVGGHLRRLSVLNLLLGEFSMFLDALAKFSEAQAITSADAYSDYAYDNHNTTPKRNTGAGEPLSVIVIVTTAATGDGASATMTDTFDISLIESANADLSSHVDIITRIIPGASLRAGAAFEFPLPFDKPDLRYIGMRYELGTDDTISVSAYLVPRSFAQAYLAYAKNYTV
jgi:hypothetical protein